MMMSWWWWRWWWVAILYSSVSDGGGVTGLLLLSLFVFYWSIDLVVVVFISNILIFTDFNVCRHRCCYRCCCSILIPGVVFLRFLSDPRAPPPPHIHTHRRLRNLPVLHCAWKKKSLCPLFVIIIFFHQPCSQMVYFSARCVRSFRK